MADHTQGRQEFLSRMRAELDSIDAQLDQFRSEYRDEATLGAKFRSDDTLETLERRRRDIDRRSRELEDFRGDNWEAARREIENARDDLRRSLDEARNRTRH
ncbi:MAG TPA: hypothetical protein VF254_10790 [Gammaproteobacteria bacterium]